MNEIHDRLEKIARNVLDDDSVTLTDSTPVADVPGWDSLAHVNFMYSVESEFGVQFSDDEFVGFKDFGDLERMVAKKLSNA